MRCPAPPCPLPSPVVECGRKEVKEMSGSVIHDLAVAYAQAKLIQYQQAHPEDSGYSNEIRQFLKWYHFAEIHIPRENEDIDLSTLE